MNKVGAIGGSVGKQDVGGTTSGKRSVRFLFHSTDECDKNIVYEQRTATRDRLLIRDDLVLC